MRILGGLVVVFLAGWLVAKVATAAFRGLAHLLTLGLPYLIAFAVGCVLMLAGARVATFITRWSPRWGRVLLPRPRVAGRGRGVAASPGSVAAPRNATPRNAVRGGAVRNAVRGGAVRGGAASDGAASDGRPSQWPVALSFTPAPPASALRASRSPQAVSAAREWPGRHPRGTGWFAEPGPSLAPGGSSPASPGMAQRHRFIGAERAVPSAHGRSGHQRAATSIERVVVIDHCSGVQYGQDNVQYTVYRAIVPEAALVSRDHFARHLLNGDNKWSHDLFTHNGHATTAGLAGTGGFFSHMEETPFGDTLVVIRNSRGVQVGDGNTQHNEFRIRVANVKVRLVRVGETKAIRAAVDELREHPSRAAAEAVADLIAEAAQECLVLDLTAQVTREIGDPVIPGDLAEISGRTGIQAWSDHAHVTVEVKVLDVDTDNLAAHLLDSLDDLDGLDDLAPPRPSKINPVTGLLESFAHDSPDPPSSTHGLDRKPPSSVADRFPDPPSSASGFTPF